MLLNSNISTERTLHLNGAHRSFYSPAQPVTGSRITSKIRWRYCAIQGLKRAILSTTYVYYFKYNIRQVRSAILGCERIA